MKSLCRKGEFSKQKQLSAGLGDSSEGEPRGPKRQLENLLPQPINDVLCLAEVDLVQCTSDFVFHVLEEKGETRPGVTPGVGRNGALTLLWVASP